MKKQYDTPWMLEIPVNAEIDTVNTSPGGGMEVETDGGGFSDFMPVG